MLLGVLVAGVMSVHLVMAWGAQRMGERVVRALPAQTAVTERERLRLGFECAARAIREKQASEADFGALMRACKEALTDGAVTPTEIEAIWLAAQRCCGLPREAVAP
jgi:hypothetical protein